MERQVVRFAKIVSIQSLQFGIESNDKGWHSRVHYFQRQARHLHHSQTKSNQFVKMNLNKVKEQAVKTALTKLIIDSSNTIIDIADWLNTKIGSYNYNNDKFEKIKQFRELQQTIDEAFCELHDPKPTPVGIE